MSEKTKFWILGENIYKQTSNNWSFMGSAISNDLMFKHLMEAFFFRIDFLNNWDSSQKCKKKIIAHYLNKTFKKKKQTLL